MVKAWVLSIKEKHETRTRSMKHEHEVLLGHTLPAHFLHESMREFLAGDAVREGGLANQWEGKFKQDCNLEGTSTGNIGGVCWLKVGPEDIGWQKQPNLPGPPTNPPTHMYICTHTHKYAHTNTHMHTQTQTYTHNAHTYTHTHKHTQTHMKQIAHKPQLPPANSPTTLAPALSAAASAAAACTSPTHSEPAGSPFPILASPTPPSGTPLQPTTLSRLAAGTHQHLLPLPLLNLSRYLRGHH